MTGASALAVGRRRDQRDIAVSELHLCSGNLLETLIYPALKREVTRGLTARRRDAVHSLLRRSVKKEQPGNAIR